MPLQPRRLLSDVLRDTLGLTGTHVGCEHGVCGACTVLVDERPTRSCLLFAIQMEGHAITTVEAVAKDGRYSPFQQALHEEHGLQCGFCTPGIIMTIEAFLKENVDPTDAEIRDALVRQSLPLHRLPEHCCRRPQSRSSYPGRPIMSEALRSEFRQIGRPLLRKEDYRLLTGQARYVDDIAVPGALHAHFVRSPHAHARIRAIAAERARAMPGVVAVTTGRDLLQWTTTMRMAPPIAGLQPTEITTLPVDKVRFQGDPVVCVVATRSLSRRRCSRSDRDRLRCPAARTQFRRCRCGDGLAGRRKPAKQSGLASIFSEGGGEDPHADGTRGRGSRILAASADSSAD